jgi:hypothetical protein
VKYQISVSTPKNIKPFYYKCFNHRSEISGPIPDPLLNWVTELSNVSSAEKWVLLTNLKAATAYQLRVSAVNRVGEGSPSESSGVVKLPQEGKFFFVLCWRL